MVGTGVNLVLAIYRHRRLIDNREEEEYEKLSYPNNIINSNTNNNTNNNTKNRDNIFLDIFKIW